MDAIDKLQNLDWLKEITDKFSKITRGRKNLIEIAGYPSWENVNSNILAFYFDPLEEHGFKTLFLDGLLEIISENLGSGFDRSLFEYDSISISREYTTNKGNRIDILIASDSVSNDNTPDWAIIIENKIYAELYNDLVDYWESANAKNKVGVVLCISENDVLVNKISELYNNGIYYCVITHEEFINVVQQNLAQHYIDSDDRHLLFLKEYIANIKSHYPNPEVDKAMDDILHLFHDKSDYIKTFYKVDKQVMEYISKSLTNVMMKFGFKPQNENSYSNKHYILNHESDAIKSLDFTDKEIEVAEKFRFWFDTHKLKASPLLRFGFEIFGNENTQFGERLINALKTKKTFNDLVKPGSYCRVGGGYYWIYDLEIPVGDFRNNGFESELYNKLNIEFFDHENSYLKVAIQELTKIIKQD